MTNPSSPERRSRGIQSVEVGGQLLLALAHHGRPMPLKDLAALADMPPAKAHPYVVSFIHIGLMQQDTHGHYGLGPLALQLGLISLQQYDPIRLATPVIETLAQTTGHTTAIAVWGNRGATVVRVAESPTLVYVTLRHGTVLNVADTATGSLFAAHLEASELQAMADYQTQRATLTSTAFTKRLAQIRQRGLASAVDIAMPGLRALAAPVFDVRGRIVLALTMIGLGSNFDASLGGGNASALLEKARELSQRLGAE